LDTPRGLFNKLTRWVWVRVMLFQRGMTLGVRVIALNNAGEVLLVRHGYTAGWHLPGGGVDYRETMEQAARRELEEETGYRATSEVSLRGLSYNSRQWKGDHVALYTVSAIENVRAIEPGLEIAEIGFFALDSLPDGTTKGTRARLAEWQDAQAVDPYWA
jgi:8-oxo-dGTP pyrophosphatase MutT (NUDIX family)